MPDVIDVFLGHVLAIDQVQRTEYVPWDRYGYEEKVDAHGGVEKDCREDDGGDGS